MKIQKYAAAASVLSALFISPAVMAQLMMPIGPTTTTSTTSTTTSPTMALPCFPLPAGQTSLPPGSTLPPGVTLCAPTAPAATPFSASMGKGYEEANEHGKEAQEEHFAMTGTFSGDVLTVTAISHGHLRVGSKLTGAGLPGKGVQITELLTGKGGVGTYKFKAL